MMGRVVWCRPVGQDILVTAEMTLVRGWYAWRFNVFIFSIWGKFRFFNFRLNSQFFPLFTFAR